MQLHTVAALLVTVKVTSFVSGGSGRALACAFASASAFDAAASALAAASWASWASCCLCLRSGQMSNPRLNPCVESGH